MGKQNKTAITPTRSEDYPEWYQQVRMYGDKTLGVCTLGKYNARPR